MRSRHGRRLLAAVVGSALVAAGCGSDDTGAGPGGGASGEASSITIALGSEPTTLDPQLREDGGERAVNDNVYETLLARDADGELEPRLAASMPTQVDDTTWEVTIRDGIEFHNGEVLTAGVVAAAFQRIIDPGFGSEQAAFYEGIESVEAVDETTVRFTTAGPDPVFPSRLYWIKVVPLEHAQSDDFADNPVGTGPYRFVRWNHGEDLTLEAHPGYWGEAPAIEEVTYRFVPEPDTRLAGLLSGEFDLITNLLPEDVDRAPKHANVLGLEHPAMILDATDGPTADVRVRQAMNYAIDKQALAQNLYGGFARIDECQILSPSYTGFNEALEAYPYDPERARQLLAEAGAEGATIQLVSTSGRWLKDREVTEAVAGYWSEVGLRVEVQLHPFERYLDRLFDREVRAAGIFVTSSNELFDAARVTASYYDRDGIGASNDDEELAALLDEAATETDVDAREVLYAHATQLACDKAYFAFLLNIEDIYGMSERLQWTPRVDAKLLVSEMSIEQARG